MPTARADLVYLSSSGDHDGETIAAVGANVSLSIAAGDTLLVSAHSDLRRRYQIHAIGGQIWVSFGVAPNAAAEPRVLLEDGTSIVINLQATHTIRVAAATLG